MACRVEVQCEDIKPGEELVCVGATPALGEWNVAKAVVLGTSPDHFPVWSAELADVVEGTEFKFVIRSVGGSGDARWESFEGNRKWPEREESGDDLTVSTTFGNSRETMVIEAPPVPIRGTRLLTVVNTINSTAGVAKQSTDGDADMGVDHRVFIFDNCGKIEDVWEKEKTELGAGAFGSVCKATHKETKELRAIKSIAKNRLGDMEKFKEEVGLMKIMDHPNIIRLFEFFEDDHQCFMVMELSDGGDLFDRIISESTFSEAHAALLMRQMLEGVRYMHGEMVMHRDIKPENFLFDRKGPLEECTLKIIDFGLSAVIRPDRAATTMVGTPNYVAPEVLSGSYGSEADLWSCGVMLYILLSGQTPFNGRQVKDILRMVRTAKYSFDPARWCSISGDAQGLVSSLLQGEVSKRMSSKDALEHGWMQSQNPKVRGEPILGPEALCSFKRYKQNNALKKASMQLVAWRFMSEERIKELTKTFRSLDTDDSGTLCEDEIHKAFVKGGLTVLPEGMDKILKVVDADGSGQIDYTEFIAVAVDFGGLPEDTLHAAFHLFDKDGDGKIGVDELQQVLRPDGYHHMGDDVKAPLAEETMAKALATVDEDGDGKIDFDEYCKMMRGTLCPQSCSI